MKNDCCFLAAPLVQADLILLAVIVLGNMLVLEASASRPTDVTFQVPIHRLRLFRKQVGQLLGLPETEEYNLAWQIFKDSVVQGLQLTECYCSLEGKDETEVQVLRLKHLCNLAFGLSDCWKDMALDEMFRLRCFRTSWSADDFARFTLPVDGEPSHEEKLEAVLNHMKTMTVLPQLPECNWVHAAIAEIESLQAKLLLAKDEI